MSYKFSKGPTIQGDIKAADDAERNTMIDFGEDRIDLITDGNIRLRISGDNGKVTLNETYTFPSVDGTNNQVLKTDGNGNLSFASLSTEGGTLSQVIGDTAPQLGGDLDVNGNIIMSSNNNDIIIEPHGTGKIKFPSLADYSGFPILLFTGSEGQVTSSNSIKFNPSRDAIGVGISNGGTDQSGVYVAGQSTPQYKIHAVGDINDGAAFATETYADSGASKFRFMKARGTPSSPAAISEGDELGRLEWYAHTGSNTFKQSAYIIVSGEADGDGLMEFGATYNGAFSTALEIGSNKVTVNKQLWCAGGYYPTVNNGATLGAGSYRYAQIHGTNVYAYDNFYAQCPVLLQVQGSDPAGVGNNTHIYAKDVGGSGEVFVRDEGGNVTQISPHNEEGEWIYFSENVKTGKKVRVNMEKMIKKLEELTGETFFEEYVEPTMDDN